MRVRRVRTEAETEGRRRSERLRGSGLASGRASLAVAVAAAVVVVSPRRACAVLNPVCCTLLRNPQFPPFPLTAVSSRSIGDLD